MDQRSNGRGSHDATREKVNPSAVRLRSLSKKFGDVSALDNVSMEIPSGSIFGLLGPNGSGKTTLLSILCGFLKPTSGEITLLEGPVSESLPNVGAVVGEPTMWGHLSVWDNLRCARGIYDTGERDDDLAALLDTVGLDDGARSRRFRDCSTGMKQRLAISVALLGDPDVLVLDEPTNGLDPQGIADIREMVRSLSDRNDGPPRTIILASHLLNEVEQVCDHVGILNRGGLLYSGSTDGLTLSPAHLVDTTDNEKALILLRAKGWNVDESQEGLLVNMNGDSPFELSELLAGRGIYLNLLYPKASIERGFFELLSSESS